MKYILDSSGYVESASCNPISCDDKVSQEYKGTIPDGYETLDEWILYANIRAYKIVNNNLVYDAARDAELQAEWELTGNYIAYSTEERIVGQWIDGKPLYRKTIVGTNKLSEGYSTIDHGIANIGDHKVIKEVEFQQPGTSWGNTFSSTVAFAFVDSIGAVSIGFNIGANWGNIFTPVITIEYTKTTD